MKKKLIFFLFFATLIIGFTIRLYKIKNPVADWHSWRQADTAAVTRNYVKYGIDLLHPRYDDFSDVSGRGLFNPNGYRFVEFPFYNLIHFALYNFYPKLSLEVWGRLTSVFAALLSSVFLYLYIARKTKPIIGLLTSLFFLFLPYNIYFTRVILPDPLMVTLFISSIYFFDTWFIKNKKISLIIGTLLASAAILVKPVAIFFLLPIIFQAITKYKTTLLKQYYLYLVAAFISTPFILWRFWMQKYPEGIPANGWLLNGNGIRFKGAFFQWIFGVRIGDLILGNWGIFPFVAGIITTVNLAPELLVWLLSSLIYLSVFATGNIQHDYYQTAIIPSISIFLAIGTYSFFQNEISFLKRLVKIILGLASLTFMFAFSWYAIRGDYQVNHWEIVHAGQAVDKLVPKNAHVVAPYLGDTAFLYQTNRDGFPFMTMPIKDMIDRFNIEYYVSVNYDDETNAIMKKYTVIEKKPEYVIVKLVEPKRP
jgi:hypothetical protein